jgi:hypothetical protein
VNPSQAKSPVAWMESLRLPGAPYFIAPAPLDDAAPIDQAGAQQTRDRLQDRQLWPGCETGVGLAVMGAAGGKFTVHVTGYGASTKRIADRAIRCIQREKLRRFSLIMD